jgi:CheY-like chemotaxis protein
MLHTLNGMYSTPYSKYVLLRPTGRARYEGRGLLCRPWQSFVILLAFVVNIFGPIPVTQAQEFRLPAPGAMVHLSPEFTPAHLQGITIHPDNALQFDFLIYKGDQDLEGNQKKEEYKKLVKYFLASLTIPDEDQWVNLSPYEKDRIIKDDFGKTEMGRDLLAQDYMLKQITSSLIYPEDGLGKKFWNKVYERAWREYHTTDIPVNTFNKVWIVPDQAVVYESGNTAYILKSHLKVMLEEDYLALSKHQGQSNTPNTVPVTHSIGSQVIRAIILPELEKEVNEGKNFANLRQMYSGMILATWYKKALKESLLGKVYADKAKVKGIDQNPKTNEEIYQRYLKAFKKGAFNYIKEDVDKYTNEVIPRKYFSGGFDRAMAGRNNDVTVIHRGDPLPAGLDLVALASEDSLDKAAVTLNAENDQAMLTSEGQSLDDRLTSQVDVYIKSGDKQGARTEWRLENDVKGKLWFLDRILLKHHLTKLANDFEEKFGEKIDDSAMTAQNEERRKILVIDDDVSMSEVVKAIIQSQFPDYKAVTVSSGEEALKVFKAKEFAVIVSDTNLGGESGYDVVRELLKVDPDVKVLAMTGNGTAKNIEGWKGLSASTGVKIPMLMKPFNMSVFNGALQERIDAVKGVRALLDQEGNGNPDEAMKGGIDLNSANLNLQIKRDGKGVPLPLAQQNMNRLMQIQGFVPEIIEIRPAVNVPIMSELRQKLQTSAL